VYNSCCEGSLDQWLRAKEWKRRLEVEADFKEDRWTGVLREEVVIYSLYPMQTRNKR
jgi:hypothetical protein